MRTGSTPSRSRSSRSRGPRHALRLGFETLEGRIAPASLISITNSSIAEGDSGSVEMNFTVTRAGDLGPAVTVAYTTSDGTAKAGTDYTATSSNVTIPAGKTTATIAVPVTGNLIDQVNRAFSVNLTSVVSVSNIAASFAATTNFTVGSSPESVAIGDLNGDGKPDLAIANGGSSTVSILLNTTNPGAATPTFAIETNFSATGAAFVAIGDLNGDGRPDIATADANGTDVAVLLNTTMPGATTPTFANQVGFPVGAEPISLAIVDLNGDGKSDLAVTNFNSSTVSVLLNTTMPGAITPTFASHADFPVGSRPEFIVVGDLNEDGKPDLAVANSGSKSLSVLLNTTTQGTNTPTFASTSFSVGTNPTSVAIGDLNSDGKLDLAVANDGSNTVSVLLNTTMPDATTPTFATRADFTVGSGPGAVAIADLNGDGKPDIATASYSNPVSVLLNTTAPGAITPSFATATGFSVGTNPDFLAVGDLNGDGKPDIATANLSGSVSVLLNTALFGFSPPTFTTPTGFTVETNPTSVAIGDLNGDGKPDLAVANLTSGTVSVLLNTTAPIATVPSFATATSFGVGSEPESVAIGDLNGDGKPDLAVANFTSGTVSVLLNTTAQGAATPSFATATSFGVGSNPVSVAIGDLNGDGKPDIAVANYGSNTVSVLLNTMAPLATVSSFATATSFGVGVLPRSVAIGDLNGDGKPDIAVANSNSNTVSVLLNKTAVGSTTPSFAAATSFGVGASPQSIAIVDLNGDGKPDLAVANYGSGTVSVLLNTTVRGAATPAFATATSFGVGTGPQSVAIGDLNGDGVPDLVVANYGSGTVSVLLNTTAPGATALSFATATSFEGGTDPFSIAIGDLSGDGKPDLAVVNFGAKTVSMLLNTTSLTPSATITQGTATGTIDDDDSPATITLTAGDGQTASVGTAFPTAFAVTVKNAAGHLISNVPVTFTAPASDTNGTFIGNVTTVTVMSNASGVATAPTFTADSLAGPFTITAQATGLATVINFNLTNLLSPAFSGLLSPTITYGTSTETLTGNLAAGSTIFSGASVSITLNSVVQTTLTDSHGNFTTTFNTATLGVAGSPHTVTYAYAGNPGFFKPATDSSTTVTVTKAMLMITASPQSKIYGKLLSLGTSAFTTSGLKNSEMVGSVTLTSSGAVATAAVSGSPYTITPSAATNGMFTASNYSITYTIGLLTVNTAPLTITAQTGVLKPYGLLGTLSFQTQGLLNSDSVTSVTFASDGIAVTATVDGSPYATIPSAAMGSGLGNYHITYVNGSITVVVAPLVVVASDQSKTYGTALSLGTSAFTFRGLLNSDKVTSVMLTSAGAIATANVAGSPYSIIPTAAVGTGLDNYSIGYLDGNLTVNQATLTITASPQSKTYGTALSLGTSAFTTSGLVNSDAVTSVMLTSDGADATADVSGSPYSIIPSAAAGTGLGNYSIGYVNGNLTVIQAHLTVTDVVNTTDIGHGDLVPTPTYSYTGFVNGDTAAVVSGTPSSGGLPNTFSPAGIYTITPITTGLSATNYDFSTVVPATLSIHPVVTDILVRWGTQTMSILNLSRDLPFTDITGFEVKFSDPVNISGTGLSLASTAGGPTYAPVLGGSDQSTNDASWTLPTAVGVDRLMLALDKANIAASAATTLALFGTTTKAFSVLPGDFNGDDVVSSGDMTDVNNEIPLTYDVWADLDGSGTVDANDVKVARSKIGTKLPSSI
jgi:FG-GAP-like repeat/Calx-beta domain/MBG domain (YGX type)